VAEFDTVIRNGVVVTAADVVQADLGITDGAITAVDRGPEAGKHFHPNLWPERPLDLPENFFDGKIDRHVSRLRLRNYPEQPETPRPGQLRAGAHADSGSLTILADGPLDQRPLAGHATTRTTTPRSPATRAAPTPPAPRGTRSAPRAST